MKRPFAIVLLVLLVVVGAVGAFAWRTWQTMETPVLSSGCLVWTGSAEEPPVWLNGEGQTVEASGWLETQAWMAFRDVPMKPGRFCVDSAETARSFARKIAIGGKSEVRVVVPAHRDLGVIAATIARPLQLDSAAIHNALAPDSVRWRIIPNTYRMYWSTTAEELVARLGREHDKWWTAERLTQAAAAGMSPHEVITLAAIVQEEIAVRREAARVAGLYRNRLAQRMKLQADPTLKFALGDWNVRRLLNDDKSVDSPYNTYLHPGLPPGPIRTPEPDIIDAVLRAERHDFLFMCAKPDGSGEHAFASNYRDHQRNARAYQSHLNTRQIFR